MGTDPSLAEVLSGCNPTNAKMYGHLFENKATGLERGLFFSFTCELTGEGFPTLPRPILVQVDWLCWPIRSWTQLVGMTLETLLRPALPEASMYIGEHQDIQLKEFAITDRRGVDLLVSAGLASEGEVIRELQVWATLDAVYVPPTVIRSTAHTPELAVIELEETMTASEFGAPTWERFRYIFRPISD